MKAGVYRKGRLEKQLANSSWQLARQKALPLIFTEATDQKTYSKSQTQRF